MGSENTPADNSHGFLHVVCAGDDGIQRISLCQLFSYHMFWCHNIWHVDLQLSGIELLPLNTILHEQFGTLALRISRDSHVPSDEMWHWANFIMSNFHVKNGFQLSDINLLPLEQFHLKNLRILTWRIWSNSHVSSAEMWHWVNLTMSRCVVSNVDVQLSPIKFLPLRPFHMKTLLSGPSRNRLNEKKKCHSSWKKFLSYYLMMVRMSIRKISFQRISLFSVPLPKVQSTTSGRVSNFLEEMFSSVHCWTMERMPMQKGNFQ